MGGEEPELGVVMCILERAAGDCLWRLFCDFSAEV